MKKINNLFISFIFLFLCTGCSINYNIEITKDTVKESIEVTDTIMNNRSKNDILNEYQSWVPAYIDIENSNATSYDSSIKNPDFEYHEKSIQELSNGYYYTYKYNYPINKYAYATATREAYQKRKFYIGSDYIIINTDKKNLLCNYSYFEQLKVTISVDENAYKVDYTNAPRNNENKYTWTINKNNCNDSEIILKLKPIKTDNSTNPGNSSGNSGNNKKNVDSSYALYIFIAILVLLILVGYKWFTNLKEKNNQYEDD